MKNRIVFYGVAFCVCVVLVQLILPAMVRSGPAKIPKARTEIINLSATLAQYHLEYDHYPSGTKGGDSENPS